MRRHSVRAAGGCVALRRRQSAAAAGEGQARRLSHTAFRAPGLPESAAWHD